MNKQQLLADIEILEDCLEEAPIDFLGTGSDSEQADRDFEEWESTYKKALQRLRESLSQ